MGSLVGELFLIERFGVSGTAWIAGGLDAVVSAWKTGDDVIPHLDALQKVIAGTRRKPS